MAHPLVPVPTPETQPFWDGAAQGELRLPRCGPCDRAFFPPTVVCPFCAGKEIDWIVASGRATLYSYVIHHRPPPQWGTEGPRSVALADLAEGPRLVTSVVDCPQTPEALVIDMELTAVFRPFEGRPMLCFRPTNDAPGGSS